MCRPDSQDSIADAPALGKLRFALFVIYSWNFEVLLTALESYAAAGFGRHIVVIDNSSDRRVVGSDKVAAMVGEIIPTRAKLTFSQSQNYIAGVLHLMKLHAWPP